MTRDQEYVREQMMLDARAEAIKAELDAQPPTRAAYAAFSRKVLAMGPAWGKHVRRKQVRQFGHLNISQDTRDMDADRRKTNRRDFRDGVSKHSG